MRELQKYNLAKKTTHNHFFLIIDFWDWVCAIFFLSIFEKGPFCIFLYTQSVYPPPYTSLLFTFFLNSQIHNWPNSKEREREEIDVQTKHQRSQWKNIILHVFNFWKVNFYFQFCFLTRFLSQKIKKLFYCDI